MFAADSCTVQIFPTSMKHRLQAPRNVEISFLFTCSRCCYHYFCWCCCCFLYHFVSSLTLSPEFWQNNWKYHLNWIVIYFQMHMFIIFFLLSTSNENGSSETWMHICFKEKHTQIYASRYSMRKAIQRNAIAPPVFTRLVNLKSTVSNKSTPIDPRCQHLYHIEYSYRVLIIFCVTNCINHFSAFSSLFFFSANFGENFQIKHRLYVFAIDSRHFAVLLRSHSSSPPSCYLHVSLSATLYCAFFLFEFLILSLFFQPEAFTYVCGFI